MSLKVQNTKLHALREWFLTPQGCSVGNAFAKELESFSEFFSGGTLLQLGDYQGNAWLRHFEYDRIWTSSSYFNRSSTLITSFDNFPLNKDSIDCIVAPFSMEISNFRTHSLDEMDRVLKPMGYIIFWGINPLSLWGVRARLGWHSCFGSISTHLFSAFFVKRAMLSRGYVQCKFSTFYFIPPFRKEKWLSKFERFNRFGKLLWPYPAGFYCLIVQKYQENYLERFSDPLEEELFYT